jgi:lysophospholipid hydrolase
LILVHHDTTLLPSGTRKWFAGRRLHTHHHVRKSCVPHYDRLARYVAGRTIGVVFSGGGSRGLAHQGVLKSMREQNVPIDCIGGTSQGALMSALFAKHATTSDKCTAAYESSIRDMCKKMGSLWGLLSDATFPVMSYFEGKKFSANIEALLGSDTCIEDLWIKYFCVTTNISSADISVHTTGVLWRAVRASMTILDYLPPMLIDQQLFVDGGYINNLPCDVMKGMYTMFISTLILLESCALQPHSHHIKTHTHTHTHTQKSCTNQSTLSGLTWKTRTRSSSKT